MSPAASLPRRGLAWLLQGVLTGMPAPFCPPAGFIVETQHIVPITFASHTYVALRFHLLMPLYACTRWVGWAASQATAWLAEPCRAATRTCTTCVAVLCFRRAASTLCSAPTYLAGPLRRWEGEPHGAEGQAVAWVGEDDLYRWPMPPADEPLLPAVRVLMQRRTLAAATASGRR